MHDVLHSPEFFLGMAFGAGLMLIAAVAVLMVIGHVDERLEKADRLSTLDIAYGPAGQSPKAPPHFDGLSARQRRAADRRGRVPPLREPAAS